jgi:cobalt-zinc-cadmium efflux system protein
MGTPGTHPSSEPHPHRHDHGHGSHRDHGHGHARDHGHDHGPGLPRVHASYGKLLAGFWMITAFMGVEIACGWLFRSLTLMSDGFHMLSDAMALGLSAFAVSLGARRATDEKTFGFKRFEILAAFANGLTLALLAAFIAGQAVLRLLHPVPVEARPMLGVAALGLLVNVAVAWWLHRGGHEKTVNEESAFRHVLGDLGASVAAVAAALLIIAKGWLWADPALSLAIAAAMAWAGAGVMRRSGHILVEGTPEGVAVDAVRGAMLAIAQVRNVHDLHVWTMNGRDLYLSAHVEIAAGESTEKEVTARLTRSLSRDFRMDHITLQVGQCVDADCLNNCEEPRRAPASGSPAPNLPA